MATLPVLFVLLAAAQQPVFTTEMSQGEGIPVLATAKSPLRLYGRPSTAGPVVDSLITPVRTQIAFDSTRLITMRAGVIEFRRPAAIIGRVFGPITHVTRDGYVQPRPYDTLEIAAGGLVSYLQYRAELACFVAVGSDVIETHPCPGIRGARDTTARVVEQPQVEWWVRIVVDERPRGWVRVSDSTLVQIDRRF